MVPTPLRRPPLRRFGRLAPLFATPALFGLLACGDAHDPVSLLTTTETAPALDLDSALPTLPTLVQQVLGPAAPAVAPADATRLLDALAIWTSAPLGEEATRQDAERARARAMAAPALARALGMAQIEAMNARLRTWTTLGLLIAGDRDPELRQSLRTSAVALGAANELRDAGDLPGSLAATMEAAESLQQATPYAVADRLVRNARGRLNAGALGDDVARERADRLLRGAEEALAAGDYPLAIRRAYYARELLR